MAKRKKSSGGSTTAEGYSPALADTIAQIEKRCGTGAIMRLGEKARLQVPAISTGSLKLDLATGVGGFPRGRVTELYGPESSGKTTLALHVVARAQARGGVAAFIDAEHALDPAYARKLGVNTSDLLISQPDYGEQALSIAEMLLSSGEMDVIVVDSVAALIPKAELDGEMGDTHVGLQARMMSQALRKLTAIIGRTRCCVIFINQIREKIGVMFGSPETTPGGRALKFYSSMRCDIRRIGRIKDGDEVRGAKTRVKIVKNKVAPPFRQAEFEILFNRGISWEADILDLAIDEGIVSRSGSWFSHGDDRLGQGRDNVVQRLTEEPALLAEIEGELLPRLFPEEPEAGEASDKSDD